ncbi:hypothetical protein AAFC00_004261 [Neodothiora populina]|uniref:Uncharacterized protein n=1 Tax=Neodothiora populina TaxID=2781224 RepID=A0ABR3PJ29_9PEZI
MSESLQASNLFSIKGMVAVVTGGATGIGLMITKALALNGAHKVYIVGRRKDKLDEACKISPNIVSIVGDVTNKESLKSMAAQIKSETGFINLLVANSGSMGPSNAIKSGDAPLADYAKAGFEQDWDAFNSCMNVNVAAVMFTAFAFMELLDEGNKRNIIPETSSQIVVTASIGGFNKQGNMSMAYKSSKAAVTLMAKSLATELIPYNIRVNSLAPGIFPSDLATFLYPGIDDPTKLGSFKKDYVPATRAGKDEDMAGTALYLASRAGAYLNGLSLVIDGGRLSVLPSTY